MAVKHIGIVGSSIAGLFIAHRLIRKGFDVSIYERFSYANLKGAGLMLNPILLQEVSGLQAYHYSSRVVLGENNRELWRQPLRKISVLWGDLHVQLRQRLPLHLIHEQSEIKAVTNTIDSAMMQFTDASEKHFDLIIGADGCESIVRQAICPNFGRNYCGYIAVRGVLPTTSLPENASGILARLERGEFLNYWRNNTHITCYLLPSEQPLINWMWYKNHDFSALPQLLTDKNNTVHHWSLPQGAMPEKTRESLLEEAKRENFPSDIFAVMQATPDYFIQAITSGISPHFSKGNCAIIGDAAHLVAPHIGGAVNLAYYDALSLTEALITKNSGDLNQCLSHWAKMRHKTAQHDVDIAFQLGSALQHENRNWENWQQKDFAQWWEKLTHHSLYFEVSKGIT